MKKLTLIIATLLTAAACNIKAAKTTPESVVAFKTASTGQWISSCTQLLDVTNLGTSSQIFVFLNTDNTALVRIATYSGSKTCQEQATNGVKNITTSEYKFEYLVTETFFADQAKLKLTSIPEVTSTTAPQTVLNLDIKTSGVEGSKEADVKLVSGYIVIGGILTRIPDTLITKSQLKFKRPIL